MSRFESEVHDQNNVRTESALHRLRATKVVNEQVLDQTISDAQSMQEFDHSLKEVKEACGEMLFEHTLKNTGLRN